MKIAFKYFFLIIPLFGCEISNEKSNNSFDQNSTDSSSIYHDTNNNKDTLKVDTLSVSPKLEIPSTLDTFNSIKYVYVINKKGIDYFENPDSSSSKLGKLEYGTKLKVIKSQNSKKNSDKWIKIASETDSSDLNWVSIGYARHIGFIPNKFILDSSKINFLELPILFNSLNVSYAKVEYKKLNLSFSKIDSITYNQHSKTYNSKITADTSIKFKTGSYFTIQTKKSNLKFVCGNNYQRPCFTYSGYIKPIDAHIIGRYGASIYSQFLLDGNSNGILSLNSEYDGGTGHPLISPKNSKMLTFSSCDSDGMEFYSCRSEIIVYDLKGIKSIMDLRESRAYCSTKWEINGFAWIDENSFVLEVGDEIQQGANNERLVRNKRFLKVIIK
jgi:hypothetical protein